MVSILFYAVAVVAACTVGALRGQWMAAGA